MSLFNHELPKRMNNDVVKAASSFVVWRKDVESADNYGLGEDLRGLNSRQGCRCLPNKAYMIKREV